MKGAPEPGADAQVEAEAELMLPHLWQKPTFKELLDCLEKLHVAPPVWNLKVSRAEIIRREQEASTAHYRREVVAFLSTIVSSGLPWLDNDDQREEVWNEASKRLAARCGRTAMGEITRCWPFDHEEYGSFSLVIREPALTGDSLGLKTWGSSYVLAQLLHQFSSGPLGHLFPSASEPVTGASIEPPEVLELGSGTGLLGLAAAYIWRTHMVLTDLSIIMPNLAHNAELNRATIEERGGHVETAPLTWGGTEDEDIHPRFTTGKYYKLIIVADPLYDNDHPALLARAIHTQLCLESDARVLVMVPQRDEITKGLTHDLREEMSQQSSPLVCVEENLVPGEDDWEGSGAGDETQRVGFWWGVFKRDQGTES